jgi:hypothetical protein
MKITIESTDQLTDFEGVPVRVWKGVTERGAECFVFVHRIAVDNSQDAAQFELELKEMLPRGQVFDLRLIL